MTLPDSNVWIYTIAMACVLYFGGKWIWNKFKKRSK
jgi:hypothetical protein